MTTTTEEDLTFFQGNVVYLDDGPVNDKLGVSFLEGNGMTRILTSRNYVMRVYLVNESFV